MRAALATTALLAVHCHAASQGAAEGAKLPNILLLVGDDMGWANAGCECPRSSSLCARFDPRSWLDAARPLLLLLRALRLWRCV